MKYIRSGLIIFAFLIFGIGAIFLNFLIFPLAKIFIKNEKELKYFYSDIIQQTWALLLKLLEILRLIKVFVKNENELKNIKNKIIVSTHPSFVDIVILIALIPRSTCFVKKELAQNPILKNLVNSIFITNDIDLEELKMKSKEVTDLGFNLIIFPTGIRHRKNEFPKIKKGASLISTFTDKNIVPIKIFSDSDFLFINQPFYAGGNRLVTFEVEVQDEINISDFYDNSEIIMKKNITKRIEHELYS